MELEEPHVARGAEPLSDWSTTPGSGPGTPWSSSRQGSAGWWKWGTLQPVEAPQPLERSAAARSANVPTYTGSTTGNRRRLTLGPLVPAAPWSRSVRPGRSAARSRGPGRGSVDPSEPGTPDGPAAPLGPAAPPAGPLGQPRANLVHRTRQPDPQGRRPRHALLVHDGELLRPPCSRRS